jgi:hypothetical protein
MDSGPESFSTVLAPASDSSSGPETIEAIGGVEVRTVGTVETIGGVEVGTVGTVWLC